MRDTCASKPISTVHHDGVDTVPTGMMTKHLLTPSDVAARLQVSVAWVRDHSTRKHPRLTLVRIGGLLRYDAADIDRWISEQRAAGLRKAC